MQTLVRYRSGEPGGGPNIDREDIQTAGVKKLASCKKKTMLGNDSTFNFSESQLVQALFFTMFEYYVSWAKIHSKSWY